MSDPLEQIGRQISDMPMWVVIVLALASGVSGELWRASSDHDLIWSEIAKRVLMRFSSAGLFGFATFLSMIAAGAHVMLAVAACIIVGTMGADIASAVYARWLEKKL